MVIDRNPVQVNESFQLVFSLDHTPTRSPDFSVLQRDFIVLGNNRSNSISIINGEYQRSVKWTIQLMAKQIGEYRIPAIDFGDEDSKPFTITVKPSSLASVPHDRQVLELTTDRSEVYVQGQVILTLRLLSATDIAAYEFGRIPAQALDLVVEPLGDPRQYQTRIADRSYLVLEQQYALFPQRSGPLEIPSIAGEVRLPSRSAFDPFNTGGEIRRIRSQPVNIEVKPIPSGLGGDYWLPADRVELREQWPSDMSGLVAGEPITRSIVLMADGLTSAQLPEIDLQPIDGIKQYPDQPVLRDTRGNQGIRGQRAQKLALIPGSAGIYRVPEIRVNWWNREAGRMETASLPARELVVAAAPGTLVTENGAPIPAGPPAVAEERSTTAPASRFWVWLSLLLACGWAASMAYWWLSVRRKRAPRVEDERRPDLAAAGRALQKACEAGDAAAARSALLSWGQALLAPRRVSSLNALAQAFGDEFRCELADLNRSLYAPGESGWQGQALWTLCRQLQKTETGASIDADDELLPLNP